MVYMLLRDPDLATLNTPQPRTFRSLKSRIDYLDSAYNYYIFGSRVAGLVQQKGGTIQSQRAGYFHIVRFSLLGRIPMIQIPF